MRKSSSLAMNGMINRRPLASQSTRSREEYKAINTSFRVYTIRKEQPRKEECQAPSQLSVGRQQNKKGLCMEEYQKQIKSTRQVSRKKPFGTKAPSRKFAF
jgi:hypothetical protein